MRKTLLILVLVFFLHISSVVAQEMQSPNYRLELETIEEKAPTAQEVIQNEPRAIPADQYATFQRDGYVSLSPAQNQEVTFNLSKTALTFETNAANSTDAVDIIVAAPTAFGYQLQLIKKKSLVHRSTQDLISQTECDNRQNPCTVRVAQPWKQEPAYGVGYNLQGTTVPSDFIDETYFRPFPQADSITLLRNNQVSTQHETKMVIKLNTNPTQAEGTYEGIYELRLIPTL